jgi:hypothetical protein
MEILTSKEVQIVTGKSLKSAQRIMQTIRRMHNKPKNSLVTLEEFASYVGLTPEQVKEILCNFYSRNK